MQYRKWHSAVKIGCFIGFRSTLFLNEQSLAQSVASSCALFVLNLVIIVTEVNDTVDQFTSVW